MMRLADSGVIQDSHLYSALLAITEYLITQQDWDLRGIKHTNQLLAMSNVFIMHLPGAMRSFSISNRSVSNALWEVLQQKHIKKGLPDICFLLIGKYK